MIDLNEQNVFESVKIARFYASINCWNFIDKLLFANIPVKGYTNQIMIENSTEYDLQAGTFWLSKVLVPKKNDELKTQSFHLGDADSKAWHLEDTIELRVGAAQFTDRNSRVKIHKDKRKGFSFPAPLDEETLNAFWIETFKSFAGESQISDIYLEYMTRFINILCEQEVNIRNSQIPNNQSDKTRLRRDVLYLQGNADLLGTNYEDMLERFVTVFGCRGVDVLFKLKQKLYTN